jgi:PAS domain S-box-containing protein
VQTRVQPGGGFKLKVPAVATLSVSQRFLRRGIGSVGSSAIPHELIRFICFVVTYALAYEWGMHFSETAAAPFWFPDAVLLCALLVVPKENWWIYVLATLPVRLTMGVSASPNWFLLTAWLNDSLKGLLAAYGVRRTLKDPMRIGDLRDLLFFLGFAVVLAPVLSAFGGAAARHLLGAAFWPAWWQWYLGDALANLVLTPAILCWIFNRDSPMRIPLGNWAEPVLAMAGLTMTAFFASRTPSEPALLYAPVPFLLWAAIRFEVRGASAAMVLISIPLIAESLGGRGPFASASLEQNIRSIQFFLFVIGAPALFLAVLNRERNRAEEALRASEERYREVVESQTELVCRYRPDTTLTFVNEAYCQFFGKPREQLIGHKFLEFIPSDARDAALSQVTSLIEQGQVQTVEHEVLLPDGRIGWQQWINHAVPSGNGEVHELQGIGRDITDRRRAEAALREREERIRLAAESADLALWVFDYEHHESWMSANGRRLYGFAAEETLSFEIFLARIHSDERIAVTGAIRRAIDSEETFEIEHRVVAPGDQPRWLFVRGRCLRDRRGEIVELIGVSIDLTAQKQAQLQLQSQREEMAHLSRVVIMGEMAASLAHELTQPLTAIVSNASAARRFLARGQVDGALLGELLHDIAADGQRAGDVIRGVRSLVRKSESVRRTVDINVLAAEVLRLMHSDLLIRECSVATEYDPELPQIDADPVQIQQVLLNLMINALEAMQSVPSGQRGVAIQTRKDGEGFIVVSVRDRGIGLPLGVPEKLFEQFFSTKREGMGMGLSIVRSIIEAHAGTLGAENAEGGGAHFFFRLPMRGGTGNRTNR